MVPGYIARRVAYPKTLRKSTSSEANARPKGHNIWAEKFMPFHAILGSFTDTIPYPMILQINVRACDTKRNDFPVRASPPTCGDIYIEYMTMIYNYTLYVYSVCDHQAFMAYIYHIYIAFILCYIMIICVYIYIGKSRIYVISLKIVNQKCALGSPRGSAGCRI